MLERFLSMVISILHPTTTTDDYGNPVTETTVTAIQGLIRPLDGNERLQGDQVTPGSTHRLYCLPCDLREQDSIQCDGKTYNVRFINNVMGMGRHWEVDLTWQS